jgi:hypothetical protein
VYDLVRIQALLQDRLYAARGTHAEGRHDAYPRIQMVPQPLSWPMSPCSAEGCSSGRESKGSCSRGRHHVHEARALPLDLLHHTARLHHIARLQLCCAATRYIGYNYCVKETRGGKAGGRRCSISSTSRIAAARKVQQPYKSSMHTHRVLIQRCVLIRHQCML